MKIHWSNIIMMVLINLTINIALISAGIPLGVVLLVSTCFSLFYPLPLVEGL